MELFENPKSASIFNYGLKSENFIADIKAGMKNSTTLKSSHLLEPITTDISLREVKSDLYQFYCLPRRRALFGYIDCL